MNRYISLTISVHNKFALTLHNAIQKMIQWHTTRRVYDEQKWKLYIYLKRIIYSNFNTKVF